jgi:predicted Zn-dependent protease
LSFTQYSEFINTHQLSGDINQTNMVKRVGKKIQEAVETYMSVNNQSDQLRDYKWEFNLVEDPLVNAWCMPGGKVVVYTGLLPVAQDETGLAVVLGHEIAHAVANHGNERMTQGLLLQLGGMAISEALKKKPEETRNLLLLAYGVGANIGVILPYSRMHESEADHLGVIFMAMAGYDPRRAVDFWKRMAASSQGEPPEILSTHPSNQTRIDNLNNLIEEAMKYYRQ